MGGYLSKPVLEKVSEDKTLCGMTYGASSMQGWRNSQEDAHNCCPKFDTENEGSLFAVYDGHGGAEVAEYTALHFPDFLIESEEYKSGNMAKALENAFLAFDDVLTQTGVIEKLREIAGVNEDSEDQNEDEREEEVKNLCEEASLPIDKLIEKLKSGKPISKAKAMAIFQSPAIKPKKVEDNSNEKEGTDENAECKENLAEKMLNGESQEVNSIQENGNKDSNKGEEVNAKTPQPSSVKSHESDSKSDSVKEEAVPEDSDIAKENSLNDSEQESDSTKEKSGIEIKKSDNKNESPTSGSSDIKNKCGPDGSSAGESGSSAGGSGSSAGGSGSSAGGSGSSAGGSGSSEPCGSSTGEPGSSSGRTRSGRRANGPIPESDEDESSMSEGDTDENDSDMDSDDVDFKAALKREMNEKDSSDEDEEDFEDGELDDEEEEEEYGEILSGGGEPGMDSGCTAVVAVRRGNILHVANAGDSRCVVSKAGQAIEMSFDHKPEDEIERNRIKAAGGWVSPDGRVNGGLNLSRALGDHVYKQNEEKDAKEQMISACPDVKSIQLTHDCEFLVLACDGIWNVMNCQQVVTFVHDRINEDDPTQKLSTICEELFDICLAPDTTGDGTGCDNMTCIIVRFNKRPAPESIEVDKRAAEEISESSDEHQTKRRKIDSDNVKNDNEQEKENETSNVSEENGDSKAKADIEANTDVDSKGKGDNKTDNEDSENSDKKVDTSSDKEAAVST